MRKVLVAIATAAMTLMTQPAFAHVTVQPNETIAGGFGTFFIQVPNERDDESTTAVEIEFPPVFASVSFADVEGWSREVTIIKLDEPIEAFGEEVTEVVGSVKFTGSEVEPGEFIRFPFSVGPIPEGDLEFKAIQTYESGDKVRWIGPVDSEEPAPHVNSIDLGLEEGQGQLAALAELRGQGDAAGDAAAEEDEDENFFTEPEVLLAVGALLVALIALLRGGRSRREVA